MLCLSNIFVHFDLKKAKILDLFFLHIPTTTTTGWLAISEHFKKSWNYLHCLGAMDGKHAFLQAPVSSGINFWNYKHCSICLGQCELQFPIRGCGLPGKNFRWRRLQKLWTVRENGEGFFRFSTTNTFDRKKEASSLFLCCWRSIHCTNKYNEILVWTVSEGIDWKNL